MHSFIQWLNHHGSDVYLISLSGHTETGIPIKKVTRIIWEQEMLDGYQTAEQASKENNVPLYFLGYSLGALLGQTMIASTYGRNAFHKQVLVAPAIAVRSRSYLLKLLILFNSQLTLPSYNPKEYRMNDRLPLTVYQLLFTEERKFLESISDVVHIPTLIIIDPKDELISYQKIQAMIMKQQLSNFRLVELDDNRSDRKVKYHHLILDESSMGTKNWLLATNEMKRFLFDK
jgi:esterase/lipase